MTHPSTPLPCVCPGYEILETLTLDRAAATGAELPYFGFADPRGAEGKGWKVARMAAEGTKTIYTIKWEKPLSQNLDTLLKSIRLRMAFRYPRILQCHHVLIGKKFREGRMKIPLWHI